MRLEELPDPQRQSVRLLSQTFFWMGIVGVVLAGVLLVLQLVVFGSVNVLVAVMLVVSLVLAICARRALRLLVVGGGASDGG